MNDSRVVVLGIRAEKAAQGRVLGLLKLFLIAFRETNELKQEAKLQFANSKGVLFA